MTGKTAGFNFELKIFLVSSNGEGIKSPGILRQSLGKLAIVQRKLSSKQKGSKRRVKARLDVARLHKKIGNQRKDWHYKLANKIIDEYDEIYFEDLNIDGMKRIWGRKVSDLGFSSFLTILEQKSLQKDVKFIKIGRFEPTSKICNFCGFKKTDLKLEDRTWECSICGKMHDRDLNAAKNIKTVGSSTARGECVKLIDLIVGLVSNTC